MQTLNTSIAAADVNLISRSCGQRGDLFHPRERLKKLLGEAKSFFRHMRTNVSLSFARGVVIFSYYRYYYYYYYYYYIHFGVRAVHAYT